MFKFILKRCALVIPVLLGATLLVFAIMDMTEGDPATIILGEMAPEEQKEALREELGLNDPFFTRYANFIVDLLHDDMGTSYRNGMDVSQQIKDRIGKTVILASAAVAIALIIGIPIGVFSAINHYSAFDNMVSVLSLILAAAPVFWLGLVAVQLFSLKLGWLPAAATLNRGFTKALLSLVLPAFCLSGNTMAMVVRMTRASMLEVVNQDYIDTARAKGLPEKQIRVRHMLKNAPIGRDHLCVAFFPLSHRICRQRSICLVVMLIASK